MLPQGLSGGVTVSTDDGASFAQHGTYTANLVACIDRTTSRTWVIYNAQNSRIRAVTDDDFTNPSAETNLTGYTQGSDAALWAGDEFALLGVKRSLVDEPALLITYNGTSVSEVMTPSFVSAEYSQAIAGGKVDGVDRIVWFVSGGEAAYIDDDGDWQLSDPLPLGITLIEDACCDGVYIYAIGGGGTTRAIIRSRDGKTFEVVTSATGAGANDEWNAIAARRAE